MSKKSSIEVVFGETKFNERGEVEIEESGRKAAIKENDKIIAVKLEERTIEKDEKQI